MYLIYFELITEQNVGRPMYILIFTIMHEYLFMNKEQSDILLHF